MTIENGKKPLAALALEHAYSMFPKTKREISLAEDSYVAGYITRDADVEDLLDRIADLEAFRAKVLGSRKIVRGTGVTDDGYESAPNKEFFLVPVEEVEK